MVYVDDDGQLVIGDMDNADNIDSYNLSGDSNERILLKPVFSERKGGLGVERNLRTTRCLAT